eukprot:CAMPEP_0184494822 /NCGR_PEP_ID=MMETSP0113_2-20130426/29654_1 /TAXON_ID=91329 /ORGANISM="Norrisiella sphaerica, Strain BC52" /LENGTH=1046 /DNA_ID=CAMNT_0026880725 /DNA_START=302 /DNA_END=3442 /DNA_ORIENTATION=+
MKRMNLSRASQKRARYYYNEVQLLSKLHHPNIVTYVDSFHADDHLCIVMEFYKDGNLGSFIEQQRERKEALSEEVVMTIFTQILFGVYFLHKKDIIHRDLKPKNIFINDTVVVVGDLGISKALENVNDFAKTFCGTPNYIAPELFLRQKYTKKVDVWSLGCILYEMVALRQAFGEQTSIQNLQRQILNRRYNKIPAGYSKEIAQLVDDLLQVSAKKRPSIGEVLQRPIVKGALKRYVGGLSCNMTYLQVENARRLGVELGLVKGEEKEESILSSSAGSGLRTSSTGSNQEFESALAERKWGKNRIRAQVSPTEEDPLLSARKHILDEESLEPAIIEVEENENHTLLGAGHGAGGRRRGDKRLLALWPSLSSAILAASTSILLGLDLAFGMTALPSMEWGSRAVFACDEWLSWYGCSTCVFSYEGSICEWGFLGCTTVGILMAIKVCEWFGRHRILYTCTLVQIAAWTPLLFYQERVYAVGARVLIGLTSGLLLVATPCYLGEIAPASHRGHFVALYPLFLTFGFAAALATGELLQSQAVISMEMNVQNPPDFIHTIQWECQWRQVVFAIIVAAGVLMVGLGCVPESPRWLKAQGMVWTAVHELQRLGNIIDSVALNRLGQTSPIEPGTSQDGRIGEGGGGIPAAGSGLANDDSNSNKNANNSKYSGDISSKVLYRGNAKKRAGSRTGLGIMALVALAQVTLPCLLLLRPPPCLTGPDSLFPSQPSLAAAVALAVLASGIYLSSLLLDTTGRRGLLLTSLAGMSIIALGTGVLLSPLGSSLLSPTSPTPLPSSHHSNTKPGTSSATLRTTAQALGSRWAKRLNAPVVSTVAQLAFIFVHGLGLSTVPWVLAAEISSQRLRSSVCAAGALGFILAFAALNSLDPLYYIMTRNKPLPPNKIYQHLNSAPNSQEPPPPGPFPFLFPYLPPSWIAFLWMAILCLTGLISVRSFIPELTGMELDHRTWEEEKRQTGGLGVDRVSEFRAKSGNQLRRRGSSATPTLQGSRAGSMRLARPLSQRAASAANPMDAYQITRADDFGCGPPEPMWRR